MAWEMGELLVNARKGQLGRDSWNRREEVTQAIKPIALFATIYSQLMTALPARVLLCQIVMIYTTSTYKQCHLWLQTGFVEIFSSVLFLFEKKKKFDPSVIICCFPSPAFKHRDHCGASKPHYLHEYPTSNHLAHIDISSSYIRYIFQRFKLILS